MKVILFDRSSFRGARALARANPESRAGARCVWIPGPREDACPGMTEFTDLLAFIKE
jgi:hypothetical protein